ncbi:MAG: phosphoenolpyruvate--protein phosphotransferase [Actinomycetota bacterium]
MTRTHAGRRAAPGIALGPAFVLPLRQRETLDELLAHPRALGTEEELELLRGASARAAAELEGLAAELAAGVGVDEAEIFSSHAAFARDPELLELAQEHVRSGASAVASIARAFAAFAELLEATGSELFGSRVADLDDVRDRIVAHLLGREVRVEVPRVPSVVISHELLPSQSAALPPELVLGFVTETGSPTSHASILARSLGVPAVVGASGIVAAVSTGDAVAIDGEEGVVHLDPDDAVIAVLEGRQRALLARSVELARLRDRPGATADEHPVELAANVGGPGDLDAAREHGAQGAGLVRTELLFEGRSVAPSVEEQAALYRSALAAFPGQRVVFRTMDIGADKPLPFAGRSAEANPALGLRGIRLHLARPDLFRTQLEALVVASVEASAADGRPAIMFPFVSSVVEFRAARRLLDDVATELGLGLDGIEVGVMVEVPSAALEAHALAAHADFLSIGTNDLLQYLYAADRLNAEVMDLGDAYDPAFLRLVASVAAAAERAGRWVGVCGEAASDPAMAVALVGMGISELSMTPRAIPHVKSALSLRTLDECRAIADRVTAVVGGPADVREVLDGIG